MKGKEKINKTLLRQKAEELYKLRSGREITISPPATEADMLKLIHELQVHQLELELQNEELILSKHQEELAKEKYTSLFDFAPSAYFTLNASGEIAELNLAGAKMLGSERNNLIKTRLAHSITSDTRNTFEKFISEIFSSNNPGSCEASFITSTNTPVYAKLNGILANDGIYCLITAEDITYRKNIEQVLHKEAERNSLLLDLFSQAPVLTDKDLYDQALEIAIKITDSSVGFFHQVSENQQEIILSAWNGKGKENPISPNDKNYPFANAGCLADCVSQKKAMVNNDFPQPSGLKEQQESLLPLSRYMCIPVIQNDKVRLIFGVGNKLSDYTNFDVIQIQAVANELQKIHEKRKVEKDLQKIEDRWQYAIEGSNDGIWDWNVLTNEVFFSNRWKEIIGYQPDEIEGQFDEWEKRVHPDDLTMVVEALQKHFKGEVSQYVTEHRILCKDGSWKWIAGHGKVKEWTLDGKPARMFGTNTDISERKKTEEVLLKDQKIFRFLSDLLNDYVFELTLQDDGNYKMSIITGNYEGATGRSPEATGTSADFYRLILKEDHIILQTNLNKLLTEKKPVIFNCRSYARNGSIRWLEVVATPEIDEKTGLIPSIYGTVKNITTLKHSEQVLKESESRYRNLLKNLHAGIVVHLPDTSILFCNQEALELLGLSESQAEGKDAFDPGWRFIDESEKTLRTDEYPVIKVISTKTALANKTYGIIRPKTGDCVWVQVNAYPEFDDNNQLTQVVVTFIDITQRKLSDEQIRQSEEKLKKIIKTSPDGIAIISLDGTIQFVSETLLRWHGYDSPDEMVGKNTFDYIAREYHQKAVNGISEMLKGNYSGTAEYELIRKDGSRFFVEVNAEFIRDKEGNPESIFLIERNITERKKAQDALRKSEEKFRIVADNAYNWEFWESEAGKWLHHSPSCIKVTGYSADEFLNNKDLFIKIIHPDDKQVYIEHNQKIRTNRTHGRCFFRVINKDGEIRHIEHVCQAVFDQSNAFIGLRGSNIDITERILAENKLKESEVQYRNLANSGSALIWTSGIDRMCNYFNEPWLKFTGRTLEQELGYGWTEGVHPDDIQNCMDVYNDAFDRHIPFEIEYRLKHHDGSYRWITDQGTPRYDSNGNFFGYLGYCYDIDSKKEMEESLRLTQFAIDHLHDPVYWMNSKGEFIYVNKAGCESLGYTHEELLGMSVMDIDPAYPMEQWSENWQKLRFRKQQVMESVHKTKKGMTYPVEIHDNFIVIDGQEYNYAFAKNITERKKAEAILKEHQELLSRSQQISHVGSWSLDYRTDHLTWTDEVYRILGVEPQEISVTLEVFINAIHPDDRQAARDAFSASLKNRQYGGEHEHRIIRHDTDDIRYVYERYVHERDDKGAVVRTVGMVQDITEQKLASKEICWRNEDLQLMNAINRAANNTEDLASIINLIGEQLGKTFNSLLLSVFLPDDENRELRMYGNKLGNELVQKIEKLIGSAIPQIRINLDTNHPFTILESSNKGLLFIGKKEVSNRLAGYLQGTSWPHLFQKFVKKLLPSIVDLIEYQSTAAVPMLSGGKIVGYLELGSRNILTDTDLKRIQSVADHFAAVVVRYNSEKKLRESEERLSSAFRYATIGMAFVAPDGRWLKVNPAIPEMLGYTESELLSKTFQDITRPDDLANEIDYIRQMLEGTIQTYQMEKRYFHKTGRIIWSLLSVSLVHDQDGNPLHFISQIQDITKRKQAEETLQTERDQFFSLFNNIDGLVYASDPTTYELLFANQNLASLLPKDHLGGKCYKILQGLDAPCSFCTNNIILQTKPEPYRWEYYNPVFKRHYSLVDRIIRWPDGRDVRFEWGLDITELKNSLDDLENAKKLLESRVEERTRDLMEINSFQKAILDNAPIAIITTNIKGIIQSINPTFELMTGYSAVEVIGRLTPLHFHERDEMLQFCFDKTGNPDLNEEEVFQVMLEDMQHNVTEWNWVGKSGQKTFVRIMLSSIMDDLGAFQGFLGLVTDITQEKLTLESLKENEKRFHSMFYDHAALMLLVNPESGEIIEANKAAENFYGLSFNQIPKLFISDINILPLDDIKKEMKVALSQRQNYFIFKHRIASGEIRTVEVHSTPITIKGEQVLFSIIHDITERQLAEIALMKSEAENRAILQAVPDLMFRIHRDGTYLDSHSQSESSLYVPKELFIGKKVSEVLPPDLALQAMQAIDQAFITGNVEQYEYVLPVNAEYHSFENRIIAISENEVISIIRDITDRKNAEIELQDALRKLSTLIQNLQAGTFFENENRRITLVNQSFCNLFNIPATPEQLIGYDCELASEESKHIMKDPEGFIRKINETLSKGEIVVNDELYLIDGRVLERDYIPIRQNNNLLGHLWQYRDITARKASETALKMQSAAFESFALTIVITDSKGRIEWANSAFAKLTGYSVDEAIGKPIGELLKSGRQDQEFYSIFWNTLQSKQVWSGELINRRKDGSLYFEEETITPVLDSLGNISNFIAIKIDISERKRLYQELADEKRRLADIIKGTNVGTWEWNIQTGETTFNEQWAEMLGYTLDEISPTTIETWTKFAHPDDLKISGELLEKHFKGIISYYSFESRMKHRNGEWIWVLDRGRVHEWDSDGKPILISGTHQDITDRKRTSEFESELLQLSLQLTGIPSSEIEPALNMALGRIGSFLGADRAYIFEINAAENTMTNTYEWCNEGITSEIENLKDLPCDIFPNWMATLNQQENIIIPSVKELPESWQPEREILEPQGIRSLVVIPLLLDNMLIGFVGLDSVSNKREYKESEINILKVWGNMLAGLINYQRKESYIELMRQNYETFFNTIDDFLFVFDGQGNMIHVNTTVTRRLGYDTSELMGKSVLMVHPAGRRDEAGRIVGEMLAGTAEFCPVPLITKSGDYIPVETRVKHGFWDGKPVIFGVSKDISKIKLSEEKFSKAFQSNSALMAISTVDGRFLEVNDTFINKLGYSRAEVIGKTSGDLKLFDNHEFRDDLTQLLVKNIAVRDVELRTRTKSGVEIIGLFSGDMITIGEEKCLLTMMVDISERKQAEAEILKAKSEAEKANLAKSEFLSRMSHELRTPMNSILGFAQLMDMGELNPKQKKGVTHILNNGKHLLALINEVLDISGIEAGRQKLTPEPVQLAAILNEITDTIQVAANKRKVSVEIVDSPVNDFFALADRLRLKQILINLLNNAIKYNNEGGSVTITTALGTTGEQGKRQIRISITDTGNGIKPDDIGKLFQPFERIGADKTETEGTGLGLMVVKKLTEAMFGKIGVESEVGVGSTFWIELPLSEDRKKEPLETSGSQSPELHVTNKTTTILYIEDNISNIELVEDIFVEHHPEIRLVTSMYGKKTIELALEHKPGLILLDLDLPDIQGFEVLEQLLVNEHTASIPVIIISADAMPFQVEKLMKAGAMEYLTKPLDILLFLKTIEQHITI